MNRNQKFKRLWGIVFILLALAFMFFDINYLYTYICLIDYFGIVLTGFLLGFGFNKIFWSYRK